MNLTIFVKLRARNITRHPLNSSRILNTEFGIFLVIYKRITFLTVLCFVDLDVVLWEGEAGFPGIPTKLRILKNKKVLLLVILQKVS